MSAQPGIIGSTHQNVRIDPLMSKKKVMEITTLGRRTIDDMVKRGDFPHPIKLGNHRIAWRLSTIQHWIETRKTA
jgi:prophage regulatory protein